MRNLERKESRCQNKILARSAAENGQEELAMKHYQRRFLTFILFLIYSSTLYLFLLLIFCAPHFFNLHLVFIVWWKSVQWKYFYDILNFWQSVITKFMIIRFENFYYYFRTFFVVVFNFYFFFISIQLVFLSRLIWCSN